MLAEGASMIPSIFPGAELHVKKASPSKMKTGDILLYPGPNKKIVAHRVIRIEHGEHGIVFITRGDAQRTEDAIPQSAAAFVVKRVEQPWFSYDVDGPCGVLMARLAVQNGVFYRCASHVIIRSWQVAKKLGIVSRE